MIFNHILIESDTRTLAGDHRGVIGTGYGTLQRHYGQVGNLRSQRADTIAQSTGKPNRRADNEATAIALHVFLARKRLAGASSWPWNQCHSSR